MTWTNAGDGQLKVDSGTGSRGGVRSAPHPPGYSLEAARKAQQQKQKDESEGASDLSSRIVEMEQTISTQGQQLRDAAAKVERAKAEAAAEVQEQLSKSRAECEGWKRKSEAATELADKLTAA